MPSPKRTIVGLFLIKFNVIQYESIQNHIKTLSSTIDYLIHFFGRGWLVGCFEGLWVRGLVGRLVGTSISWKVGLEE